MNRPLFALVAVALAASVAAGQSTSPEAELMRACIALSERGQLDSAAAIGKSAEATYRKRIARSGRDVEALVGLGRTLAQCLLPAANFIGQGTISQEAMSVLEDA